MSRHQDQLEDELRAALAARAETVRPRPGAWDELRSRARRPPRGPRVAVALGVAAAAATTVAVVALAGSPSDTPVVPVRPAPPSALATPSPTRPADGTVLGTWSVPGFPTGASAGLGHVWVTSARDGGGVVLSRIDPADGGLVEVELPPGRVEAPALSADMVWVHLREEVLGVDPDTLEVRTRVAVGDGFGIGASGEQVWASDGAAGLARIDPADGTVAERVPLPGPAERVLVQPDGAVVVTVPALGAAVRVAPDGAVGDPAPLGGRPGALLAGDGLVWVGVPETDELVGLDPTTLVEVRRLTVPGGRDEQDPYAVHDPDRDAFWVTAGGGTLAQVRADDGRIVQHLRLGGWLFAGPAAYAAGDVWYVAHGSRQVLRIQPDPR
ncbi:hypothetical protein [Aquipuribacter nitratireducens]|uniref:Virginiamycin B lyase n=1 Tax=Aquipuribacter nitratireducens TaxID=650104 RepID=A0ABW0GHS0_9MICO